MLQHGGRYKVTLNKQKLALILPSTVGRPDEKEEVFWDPLKRCSQFFMWVFRTFHNQIIYTPNN